MTVAREAPAPGVMYEYVAITDSTIQNGKSIPNEGQMVYQFRVFNPSMLGIKQYQYDVTSTASLKNMAVKDYTSQVGNLIRTIKYDRDGNKLTESINHFLNDDLVDQSFDQQVNTYEPRLAAYNYQGVIQERYGDPRTFVPGANSIYKMTMSGRDKFPVIPTGTTLIDYKNGTKIDQQSLAFDFYSGNVTKTLTIDAFGNRFVNTVVPAYHIYASMGVKVYDNWSTAEISRHRNMLTQEAENYTYKVDNNNNPIGIITASAQTWGTDVPVLDPEGNLTTAGQTNIWRTKANYSWMPAGRAANNITPVASFAGYFSGGSSNPSWKKTSQINLYNVYSNALEASDINNQYAATRMGYKNSKVIISGSLAKYDEIAYASAEDEPLSNGNFSTNVSAGSGSINTDTTFTHTGIKSLKVSSGLQGFNYVVNRDKLSTVARDYNVAVWVKPSSGTVANAALYYQVGGGTVVTPAQAYSKTAAGWYLLEMRVPAAALPASGNLTVGCKNTGGNDLYFDDFRFQPSTSAATAYVYDRRTGEPTYIIGNNNLFIRYQYDAAGRLVRTYREVLGKAQVPLAAVNKYHYALSGGVSTNEFHPSVAVNAVAPGSSTTIGFSANDGGASTPTTYNWTFGDGTTSTLAGGSHGLFNPRYL